MPSSIPQSVSFSLPTKSASDQFEHFLRGDAIARRCFPAQAQRELMQIAVALVRDLPEGAAEELVQEMWADVLSKSVVDFDATRGSAKAYLRGALRNAVKAVRASYAPPGERARDRRTRAVRRAAPPPVTASPTPVSFEVREQAAAALAVESLEAHLDAETILLDLAPAPVARALFLVHMEGASFKQAAESAGLSRHQLHRRVRTFCAGLGGELKTAAA